MTMLAEIYLLYLQTLLRNRSNGTALPTAASDPRFVPIAAADLISRPGARALHVIHVNGEARRAPSARMTRPPRSK